MLAQSSITSEGTDLLWKLNFDLAEQYLYSKMSLKSKQTFYLLQILLSGSRCFQQQEVFQYFLCHTFLWNLEQEDPVESGDIVQSAHKLLNKLLDRLIEGTSPHYFIPNCNLLSGIPGISSKSVIHCIKQTLENFQSILTMSRYLPIQLYSKLTGCNLAAISREKESFQNWLTAFEENICVMLKKSLLQTFDEIVQLLMVTSHAKLHSHNLDRSILRHKEVMKILLKDPFKLNHTSTSLNKQRTLDGYKGDKHVNLEEKYINPFMQVLQVWVFFFLSLFPISFSLSFFPLFLFLIRKVKNIFSLNDASGKICKHVKSVMLDLELLFLISTKGAIIFYKEGARMFVGGEGQNIFGWSEGNQYFSLV